MGLSTLGEFGLDGFFILGGFLVIRSFLNLGSFPRYARHRFLRIMPGFWVPARRGAGGGAGRGTPPGQAVVGAVHR